MAKIPNGVPPAPQLYKELHQVHCPCCEGTGFTFLPIHLGEIMDYFCLKMVMNGEITCDDLRKKISDKPTHVAMNSRLMSLYRMGLLQKARKGKCLIWRMA